ncbi:MAG: RNA polymerase factor sigma-32 [Alphaproteobacteria bacterium TMED62]|nr:MAG: RNA polymerase factor sigma-32 [Alphaproteobacteria bacterium TMED62]|tara:strand:- start:938 stop:1831 length:894 start_codon:yes stop_codon:yes gene_type:complete
MSNITLPSISSQGSLQKYLGSIKKFPLLELEEEYTLAKLWKSKKDLNAAHKLVTSHLRLVAKIAMGYRGYGLPIADLISEGNIGLMQAVKRFDPDKGFRLATYAMWWIRAAIQEHILHSWSLVKIGTTAAQKKLFFNLRKIKNELKLINEGDLKPEEVKEISKRLSVDEREVYSMNSRMAGHDHSLNAPLKHDSSVEWQDWIVAKEESQETKLEESQEYKYRKTILLNALASLNEREKYIFKSRRITEPQITLEELSKKFSISRERVRQIEVRAFDKVQQYIRQFLKNKQKLSLIEK